MAEVMQSLLNPELRTSVLMFTSPTQSVCDTLRIYQKHLMQASLWKDILAPTFLSIPCDFSIVFLSKLCSFFCSWVKVCLLIGHVQESLLLAMTGLNITRTRDIAWGKQTWIKWLHGRSSKLTCELMFAQVQVLFPVSWQIIWQIHI